MNDIDKIIKMAIPGKKLRFNYGAYNPNNILIHILAIVDEDQVVYKTWLKHKQRWRYCVVSYYFLTLSIKYLKKVR